MPNLLAKAKPEMAYAKFGLYGEAGSGKTFTGSKIAIGLHNLTKATKPVAFLDTETGSDFVIPLFKKEKVDLTTAKSRAFADLLTVLDEAEKSCSILIIDSITHFWNELIDSYQKKHNLNRITLRHWMPLKAMWREFTDRYVNSKLHVIMCGRAGYIWDDVEDEEGVKELKKVGTKMKAEVETGYEPSLLIEMVKVRLSAQAGSGWSHRAWVIKDRFDIIDGQAFDNPGFESFLPHVQLLNLGGKHKALEPDRDSQELFTNDNLGERKYKKREQFLEKIKNEIILLYPGQDANSKTSKIELMKKVFGTHSWNEITDFNNDLLQVGLDEIEKLNRKEVQNVSS